MSDDLYRLHRLRLEAAGQPLFAALSAAVAGLSRSRARQAIVGGLVKVGGAAVVEPNRPLGPGVQEVDCDLRQGVRKAFLARKFDAAPPGALPFTFLHQDAEVVVVDKAAGVLAAPGARQPGDKPVRGHVPELLRRAWKRQGREVPFIGVVHRLDQDTSGCLCFALTREAQRLLAIQFATHSAGRTYRVLVDGQPKQDQDRLVGVMTVGPDGRRVFRFDAAADERLRVKQAGRGKRLDAEDDEDDSDATEADAETGRRAERSERPGDRGEGRDAVTSFKVLRRFARGAELEVRLETGRTHQIRCALAAIGCHVSGDRVYRRERVGGAPHPKDQAAPRAPRLMLHAWKLELDHPSTGMRLVVEAPVPEAFAQHARLLDG